MGQVYQATDTKLKRQVALKILPEAFSADPERLARFQREAEVLASLNHPNIAAIHGLEEADGIRALVLELVEGPTLADRIAKGPIPLDEALPIAKQIAEALEAAHEAGVIHRDLKPANIKVRDDGTVKVLDFGLAKALQPDTSDPGLSQSPTISLTAAATQMGMVIGTAAYMAPEQAKGKPVDKRADVWAFGVVLFEMLTGAKPFAGDDVSDTLALVLKFEPEWESLPSGTPPAVRQLLGACLQKDPRQRLHDAADGRLVLEGAFDVAPPSDLAGGAHQSGVRQMLAVAGAVAAVAVVATVLVMSGFTRPGTDRLARLTVSAPSGVQVGNLALSPDGQTIVFDGLRQGRWQVYARSLSELTARPVRGAEDRLINAFSPDGESVLVTDEQAPQMLRTVPLIGGGGHTPC